MKCRGDNCMVQVELGNKKYSLREAKTEEEKRTGLQNIEKLSDNEGMVFYFDSPQTVSFWMKDTKIPLDIIFIDDDQEVINVIQGQPEDDTLLKEDNVKYVIELNANSGVEIGDELEFEDEPNYVMKVLAPDGSTQFQLQGGERIVSRRETKILIKKAKKAEMEQTDSAYKSLGKYLFKVFNKQDNRKPEYVKSPKN